MKVKKYSLWVGKYEFVFDGEGACSLGEFSFGSKDEMDGFKRGIEALSDNENGGAIFETEGELKSWLEKMNKKYDN